MQFLFLVLVQKRDWEFYITCAALPVSLLLLVEGHLAARYENKAMMITFMSGCVGALVYFVYKVSPTLWLGDVTLTVSHQFFKVVKYQHVSPYATISKSLATFCEWILKSIQLI